MGLMSMTIAVVGDSWPFRVFFLLVSIDLYSIISYLLVYTQQADV